MNQYTLKIAVSLRFLFCTTLCQAQQTGTLIIEASNFETSNGVAVVHLFRAQDDVPGKPFLQMKGEIIDGKSKIMFKTIPIGEYAAILFHDENANGILDHKFGFPHEPLGFSNGWRLSLFSGMPSFTKLKFRFDSIITSYKIVIH
jgi:uncharacterized protein (DUF2141 family)